MKLWKSFNRFNWAGRENQKGTNLDNISSSDIAFVRRTCGLINYVYDFKSLAILCETFDDVAISSEKLKILEELQEKPEDVVENNLTFLSYIVIISEELKSVADN